jgi:HAD superfamily hydrolase (TIGR01509 family)
MVALPDDFEASYRSALLDAFERELHPMPGVLPVITGLSVRSCVATSSSPPRARRSLEITGLLDHFDGRIFTASEVENGKPAPDLFLHAALQMGVDPSRCLVIEDSLPGLSAGLAAGMEVWQFTGGSHLRGEEAGLPGVRVLKQWSAFPEMAPRLYAAGQRPEGVLE